MGRNVKPGISFYRMDSGHVLNRKVRLLCNEFDSDGYYIWCCLLDYAYTTWGYYFDLRDDETVELFASEYCKKKLNLVKEVIKGCIRRGLFDEPVADTFKVLTSEMMQEVYVYATAERRRQGSVFTMEDDWLIVKFDKIPVNIEIVHGSKLDSSREESTNKTKQNNTKTKQELVGAVAPNEPVAKVKSERKIFKAPDLQQVIDYFLQIIGDPKAERYWPADVCRMQAGQFVDHYTANGWVQGRGKKIVDWQAACRNWVRNELKGAFENKIIVNQPPALVTPPPSPVPQKPQLRKIAQEINYLYETFIQDETKCTTISIEVAHYNELKKACLINFSREETENIREQSMISLNGNADANAILSMMKKVGVIEFFKQVKQQGWEVIFYAE
jgi:hypothetical protein